MLILGVSSVDVDIVITTINIRSKPHLKNEIAIIKESLVIKVLQFNMVI